MTTVLFIKANDRPSEQAVSVRMYETFLQAYKEKNPNDAIVELDLFRMDLPYHGNAALSAAYKLGEGYELTIEERAWIDRIKRHQAQFIEADKIVIAFPLWNMTVPAPLITYVSYLTEAGVTFSFTEHGPVGLIGDKKAALLNARGGDYSGGTAAASEMCLIFMKNTLAFWGIAEPLTVVIEGHQQYRDRSATIIETGLAETARLAAAF
ncbi:FMN-dependent NADH-azoreductase [Paenibacillus arenilitoris]|uniref:FMN dependent NADH:quinone oxidoreductase n=1 Tax=Paenibacillus arenilitoris TaxID=2772299 RepID=A0A927CQK4_9BACL|nr:FMN-dependent NADH-azoreductase [Paenibacillus arenilitoris]